VPPEELPITFGRYTLLRLLGQGGMGRVFEAELSGPSGFRKRLALKVVAERSFGQDDRSRDEFLREARIGGLLRHPNVIDCYDFGVTDGHPFIAMELVDGLSLRELVARGPLPPTVLLDCAVQICEGLAHAHGLVVDGEPLELVHRDLKPSNLLVTRQGLVKILDFGLARASQAVAGAEVAGAITKTGTVRGTPSYMSPEQANGSDVDPRSDLFALGAVLFELATGERFFDADDLLAVMMAIVDVDNRNDRVMLVDGVAPGLGGLLGRLLRSDPGMRYGRASDLAVDLRVMQRRLPPGPDLRTWVGRLSGQSSPSQATPSDDGPDTIRVDPSTWPVGSLPSSRASAMAARRTNLSAEGARFVGREGDVAALDEALREGSLVTLAGTAGAGKTRLATHYGLQRLDRYVPYGGVWFCNLVEARTVAGLLHEVARVLAVPLQEAGPADGVQRLGWALAGRGRILLIFDNFEQLGPDAADAVATWIDLAPEALFVVTSRAPLRLPAERVLEVGPLPDDQGVRLFEARAKTVRADFAVREDEVDLVQEIVRRLDGIPLAIELAAARTSVLSPRRILDRLDQRFKLLAGGHRGAGARGTLRGAIDWSWELLEAAERDALLQVSVFLGGFTLEAAEEVVDLDHHADAPWVLDVLESLRDKSMLRTWRPEGLGGEIRFGMYESIREYARGKRDSAGPADRALVQRHGAWAVRRGEELEWKIGGVGGGRAHAELALEIDNLFVVVDRAEADGDADLGVRAAVVAAECFRMSGSSGNRRRVLERGLALSGASDAARAGLHLGMARVLSTQTEEEASMWHASEAIDLARRAGLTRIQVQAMWKFSDALTGRGDLARSLEVSDEALALANSVGDSVLVGWALSSRGRTHQSQQRYGDAYDVHARAAELFTAAGRPRAAGMEINSMAIAAVYLGRHDEGERLFARCLQGSEANGYNIGRTRAYCNLGLVRGALGRVEEGLTALRKALRLSRRAGDTSARVLILVALADLTLLEGDVEQAVSLHEEVAGLLESRPIPYLQATWHRSYATSLFRAGRIDDAIAACHSGVRWSREDEGRPCLISNTAVLAVIHACLDDVERAHAARDDVQRFAAGRGPDEDLEDHYRELADGFLAALDARVALQEGRSSDAESLLDSVDGDEGPLPSLEGLPYLEVVIRVLVRVLRAHVVDARASLSS